MNKKNATKLANEYYAEWNGNNTKFIFDANKVLECIYGFIFFATTESVDNASKIGGSGCILITNDGVIYPLRYFGNIDEAIKDWEKSWFSKDEEMKY